MTSRRADARRAHDELGADVGRGEARTPRGRLRRRRRQAPAPSVPRPGPRPRPHAPRAKAPRPHRGPARRPRRRRGRGHRLGRAFEGTSRADPQALPPRPMTGHGGQVAARQRGVRRPLRARARVTVELAVALRGKTVSAYWTSMLRKKLDGQENTSRPRKQRSVVGNRAVSTSVDRLSSSQVTDVTVTVGQSRLLRRWLAMGVNSTDLPTHSCVPSFLRVCTEAIRPVQLVVTPDPGANCQRPCIGPG